MQQEVAIPAPSSAIAAAICALRGESDLDDAMPALADEGPARSIACAPGAHPLVGAVAALCGGRPSVPDPPTIADPAPHNAVAHLIGTPAGRAVLRSWAAVAPARWGAAHAEARTDAVRRQKCNPGAAAALIGPDDRSASLLRSPDDAAFAIRRRGQCDASAPSAWAEARSAAERKRLIDAVCSSPSAIAFCLPWLPPDAANRTRINDVFLDDACDAFAVASPIARTQRAAILRRLVARAHPMHLLGLTRLACATGAEAVWRRAQTLVRTSPDDAWRVVVAAPWDDLPDDLHTAILPCADRSPVCAAVAAARGKRTSDSIFWTTAAAFFAALDLAVWDSLDPAMQPRWRQTMRHEDGHLAMRALGLRPEFLARALLNGDLAHAVRHHACTGEALRAALLPVALRRSPPAAAHAVIAALPLPSDPGAFFVIVGGHAEPSVIASARATRRTPADLACAVALQRSVRQVAPIPACCAALQQTLCERTWDDRAEIVPLLDAAARAALAPDSAALVGDMAHPDRQDALRRALDLLAALPPAVTVPTRIALMRGTPWNATDAAAAPADTLRAHGGVILALTDALADVRLHAALLPLPEDGALADALRAMARDDPVTARRLARACRDGDRRAVTGSRWRCRRDPNRRAGLTPAAETLVARLARPGRRDALHRAPARLESLPLAIDIPARFALHRWGARTADASAAAAALLSTLHQHGDVVLARADALTDVLRAALLPLPEDARQADALRALVQNDPVGGRAPACALHGKDRRRTLPLLLYAPPQHAGAVWQALTERERRAIVGVLPAGRSVSRCMMGAIPSPHARWLRCSRAIPTCATRAPRRRRGAWQRFGRGGKGLSPAARYAIGAHPAVADLPVAPDLPCDSRRRHRWNRT